jgi:hypothetical protein
LTRAFSSSSFPSDATSVHEIERATDALGATEAAIRHDAELLEHRLRLQGQLGHKVE